MIVNDNDPALGIELLGLASRAERELVLCAPFAKTQVLERILAEVAAPVDVMLFTRWRPEEVAAGVSDTGVLHAIQRYGGRVMLHDRLHAKYYRNDDEVLIGSANLTGRALGWSRAPNLEILTSVEHGGWLSLEKLLLSESIEADEEMALSVEDLADQLRPQHRLPPDHFEAQHENTRVWVPQLRQPEDLFVAYQHGSERLSSASAQAAKSDLHALECPMGLDREQFYALVASRLLQQPVVRLVDAELSVPRTFGHMSGALSATLLVAREDADLTWQALMRWLLEFLPTRYRREVRRWSEMFYRTAGL